MPLPTFEKAEEIPEAFRDSYIEKDGKFVPDIEDVAPLKNAHERQKAETRAAKEQAAHLAQRLAELEQNAQAKARGITDEQLQKWREEMQAEKRPLEEKLSKYEQELRTLKLDNAVKSMMAKAGVVGPRVDALFKLVGDRFDLSEDGTPILRDKPVADLQQYLATDVASEYPEFYASTQKAGMPAPHRPGASRGFNPQQASLSEKLAFIKEHGPSAYEELLAASTSAA